MGFYRLFTKSIVFSTRSRRRFFTFVIVFSILSGATILLLSSFDNSSREGMLDHRGVVIRINTVNTIDLVSAQNTIRIDDGGSDDGISTVIYYKYIEFGTNILVFSMRTDYPWAFAAINPTNLIAGRFPVSSKEVLVSNGTILQLDDSQGNTRIYIKPVVGMTFKIGESEESSFEIKVVGVVKIPTTEASQFPGKHWLIMPEKSFDALLEDLNPPSNNIYIHSITFVAPGDFFSLFSGRTYTYVNQIAKEYTGLPADYEYPIYKDKSIKDGERNMLFLSLFFGLFGTFMVSTLYSYLITRFRRREVAVLKAMGYSKWDVRTVVLTEILVVAVTGFIIGLLAIQFSIVLGSSGSYIFWIIFSSTAIMSFLAVVISCVPGFILITTRTLAVRPIELFRQK